jgi:hypothetical protein
MLSDAEREVVDSRKYRPGQFGPILVGGAELLKPVRIAPDARADYTKMKLVGVG